MCLFDNIAGIFVKEIVDSSLKNVNRCALIFVVEFGLPLSFKTDFTLVKSFGNRLSELKLAAEGFGDAPVSLHGDVAKHGNPLIVNSLGLPCRHQRTVVKIDVQAVVRARQDLHLENDSRRQSEKLLLQAFKAFGACRGRQLITLKAPASHNGRFGKVFTLQAMLLRFIKQKMQAS